MYSEHISDNGRWKLEGMRPHDFNYTGNNTTEWVNVSGRAMFSYYGIWGSICSHNVNNETAQVFCRSVNMPYDNAYVLLDFGFGNGSIWYDDV